jgi:lipopolysaccharide biosynthesis regulator YciM
MKLFRVLAFACTAAALAGCVSQGPFPSLAPRPDERLAIDEPVREAPQIADDSALRVRINQLAGEARAGGAEFERDYDSAARANARAGAQGSDSWIEAQMALSRVETARGRTTDAVAELHQIAVARANEPTSAGDLAALQAAIDEADGIVAAQQARLNRLRR